MAVQSKSKVEEILAKNAGRIRKVREAAEAEKVIQGQPEPETPSRPVTLSQRPSSLRG